MQDRFKCRIWNKRTKEYLDKKGINTIFKGAYNETMLLGLFQYLKDDKKIQTIIKDFNFEQCTGLKDKNGKLIYEGDVLNLKGVPNLYQCVFNLNRVGFDFKPLNTGYKWSKFFNHASDFLSSCTFVGNINENPELLEEN